MKNQIYDLKADCKERADCWEVRIRYRDWSLHTREFRYGDNKFKAKDDARQYIHKLTDDWHGSVIEEEIDRLKILIDETYKETKQ
jgi:hypothetical protein